MKIAIAGGGLAGVALAWHILEHYPYANLHLYDHKGIAGGASGVAAGLMAPFGGARANAILHGSACIAATLRLVHSAKLHCGRMLHRQGVLRPALTLSQQSDFRTRAQEFPGELEWWENERCVEAMPELFSAPGLWLRNAYQIDTCAYLQALWNACEQKNARLIRKRVQNWRELDAYDYAFAAMGAESLSFDGLADLPAKRNKGQIVGLDTSQGLSQPPFAVNSHAYYVADFMDRGLIWAGATYEHDEPLSEEPNLDSAWRLLQPRLTPMIPALRDVRPSICLTGMRLTTKDYLPYVAQVGKNRWVLTGMGSKGILYHAYYAEKLVTEAFLERKKDGMLMRHNI